MKWLYFLYSEFIIIRCNLSVWKQRQHSKVRLSRSNLKKHLERVHADTKLTVRR